MSNWQQFIHFEVKKQYKWSILEIPAQPYCWEVSPAQLADCVIPIFEQITDLHRMVTACYKQLFHVNSAESQVIQGHRPWANRKCTVWVKKSPLRGHDISHFSHKRLRIFNRFFTHLLNVPIYARLQIFIQLSPSLTTLCYIKRDYPVHIMLKMSTISRNACVQTFAQVVDSFVDRCLWQVTIK